ncbi:MAG TPA: nucleotidyltransferase family protein [Pyrinomonadaceae bacterium]|nr:nucleotidyltransferase family protein [Pyrinomonadaceae bacterium]
MAQVSAILLAAGRSRRMGAFKPLLPFGDSTVIKSCLRHLSGAGVSEIVVVLGHRADELRGHLKDFEVTFAVNPDPESEMSVSIARGLEQIGPAANALLIALVDHPAVDSGTIRAITDEWARGSKFVQPEHNGRGGHPVLMDLSFRDELLHLDPEKGLRNFFEAHRVEVRRLAVESPFVARDMDTWEDYVSLHQDVFGRPPQG